MRTGGDQGELLLTSHQWRMLAERSPDVLSRHGSDATFLFVSPAIREMLGWEPSDVLGRRPIDFVHPDDTAAAEREREALLRGDDDGRHLYRMRHRSGHYLWVESTSTIVSDNGDGTGIEVVSARRDVTQRVAIEALVRESEQRFRLAFEGAPIGISLVSPEGRWLRVNDAMCEILGYSRDRLLQMTFMEITHPDDLEHDLELTRMMLAGERRTVSSEKRYLRPSGESVWVQMSASLARDGDEPLYFITQVQDVSERRAAQEALAHERRALERSNPELERFAGVISHDLQASLRTVGGFAELLMGRLKGRLDDQAERDLSRIVNGVRRMQSLLDGIRAYSRVQLEDAAHRRAVDGNAILEGVRQSLAADLDRLGGRIEVEDMPHLYGDPVQLHQLFENLIANALKFRSEAPPLIRVRALRENGWFVFSVTDNGIGIAPTDAERVFDMGRRLHAASKYPGNGMGLAICRAVAERHGGSIRALADGEGGGMTVEIRLPAGAEAAAA